MFANDGRRLAHAFRIAARQGFDAGAELCLATIVRTEGSTYRKAGAQMLVGRTGPAIGLLSGGCLEDEIVRAARALLDSPAGEETRLLFFDLMPESEFLVGYGKGCSGQLTVLVERFVAHTREEARILADRLALVDEPCGVALVYEARGTCGGVRAGDRLAARDDGETLESGAMPAALRTLLVEAIETGKGAGTGHVVDIALPDGQISCSIHYLRPPQDLIVFGAGPDAPALARLADQMGFDVRVLDHRPARLDAARFPESTRLVAYKPEAPFDALETTPRTAVVIMTHNLLVDAEILKASAERELFYVGLLGPTHRRDRVYDWLRSQGTELPGELRRTLHAPIGLDLGGAGEWDIALAVTAEIQKLRHDASAQHRRDLKKWAAPRAAAALEETRHG